MGGFQLPLRSGTSEADMVEVNKASLNKEPLVPGASILVRVLPITKVSYSHWIRENYDKSYQNIINPILLPPIWAIFSVL